ncbi:myb-related transcription factor, partner of profilin-like [Ambystoma mexicanum]|uniref:myb-related transcription factor, partner of profilin-like n=1 Tax=Ambystoma mexicanum TaxID=8296 RepID=UPI0037E6FBE8
MPKAVKKNTDRLRKERFSREELTMLAETLQEHANVVFSSDMSRAAVQRKKQIWVEVAQKVSAVGTTLRTPKDCRKRWDDLRLLVQSILSSNRNLGMATGGGPHSDSGDEDTREEDATSRKKARGEEGEHHPSTSRGIGQPAPQRKAKKTPEATAPMCTTAPTTAPTTAASTQEAATEGTASAASSTVGKTAATAAVSDDEEDQLHGATPATGPLNSPQLSPCSMHDSSMHRLSPVHSWPATPSPTPTVPEEHSMSETPPTSTAAPTSQEGIRAIQRRQEELTGLLTQHITECGRARDDIRECAASLKTAIESSSKDICAELAAVRHVLSEMVAAIQAMPPPQLPEQPGTSSNASSTRTSPGKVEQVFKSVLHDVPTAFQILNAGSLQRLLPGLRQWTTASPSPTGQHASAKASLN